MRKKKTNNNVKNNYVFQKEQKKVNESLWVFPVMFIHGYDINDNMIPYPAHENFLFLMRI